MRCEVCGRAPEEEGTENDIVVDMESLHLCKECLEDRRQFALD